MATQIKRFSLVLLVALVAATYVSSASAFNLRSFGARGKPLYRLNGKTFASKVAAAQEVREARDYGPPGSNPPYHDDPPSPFTMANVNKLKSVEKVADIRVDYASVTTHPIDYDYRPPGESDELSSKTAGFHTDYDPMRANLPNPDYGHPSRGELSSKTASFHPDYTPWGPHPPTPDN